MTRTGEPTPAGTTARAPRTTDRSYREQLWEDRYAEHVRPINEWIDTQVTPRRWMPYISPVHAADAHVLDVVRSPLPATDWHQHFGDEQERRGMLSVEDDDPTAVENHRLLTEVAGLELSDMCPWNAFPFYRTEGKPLSANEIGEGGKLVRMLLREVLTQVSVVVLQGPEAAKMWTTVVTRDRRFTERYKVLRTWDPSRRGAVARREQEVATSEAAWREISAYLA